ESANQLEVLHVATGPIDRGYVNRLVAQYPRGEPNHKRPRDRNRRYNSCDRIMWKECVPSERPKGRHCRGSFVRRGTPIWSSPPTPAVKSCVTSMQRDAVSACVAGTPAAR